LIPSTGFLLLRLGKYLQYCHDPVVQRQIIAANRDNFIFSSINKHHISLMNPNYIAPSTTTSVVVDPNELPDGFTTVDPKDHHPAGVSRNTQGNNSNNTNDEFQRQAILQEQKQMILEQAMDGDALARLGRIKLVRPDKAASVENTIISMAMQGRLPGPISEGKLIEILERGNRKEAATAAQSSSTINIQRKNYAMDSDNDDDDDDNDDDV
jgi:programmed cell death protein 5